MIKRFGFALSIMSIILCLACLQSRAETRVATFNGEVRVTIIKDGKPTEETIILKPGEALVSKDVVGKVSLNKTSITWKDIAQYEQDLVARDPYSRLFVDNSWAKRINKLLDVIAKKYNKIPDFESVLEALGIPKDRPSGKGVYKLIPGPDSPKPEIYSRVYYLDENLNEYLDPYEKIADSVMIETVEKTASRSD